MRRTYIPIVIVACLAGCSGGSEPSAKDDATAKNNFTRALTPEEQAKMNGAPPAGAPAKGAPPAGGPP